MTTRTTRVQLVKEIEKPKPNQAVYELIGYLELDEFDNPLPEVLIHEGEAFVLQGTYRINYVDDRVKDDDKFIFRYVFKTTIIPIEPQTEEERRAAVIRERIEKRCLIMADRVSWALDRLSAAASVQLGSDVANGAATLQSLVSTLETLDRLDRKTQTKENAQTD